MSAIACYAAMIALLGGAALGGFGMWGCIDIFRCSLRGEWIDSEWARLACHLLFLLFGIATVVTSLRVLS